jgi:hypothetical protein
MRRVRLIATVPEERIDRTGGDGSSPKVGDIAIPDQGFTFPDGRSGGSVYALTAEGKLKWSADVLDSEIELIPDDEDVT